jgi:uncharacterized DUF497 family protein
MDIRYEWREERFVWDEDKARTNRQKHGVAFEEAVAVFFDPFLVLVDASRHAEARDAAIGFDASGRLLFVVHVVIEDDAIRIVSARCATLQEEYRYAD